MDPVSVRAEEAADVPAIHAVNRAAFGRDDEALLIRALRDAGDFDPVLSRVAVLEDAVVGHVLFPDIAVVNREDIIPALALAPVAVLPAFQRQGIGSLLIRDGLATCRDMGHRIVIVLGNAAYYSRFGFCPAGRSGISAPFPAPAEEFMALPLVPDALTGVRGTVRYPAAFDIVC
jgi:putative acetyltransferase